VSGNTRYLRSRWSQFDPGDVELIHAVFVGGANLPARVRVFVDFLIENLR